jgi:hypothetical protein
MSDQIKVDEMGGDGSMEYKERQRTNFRSRTLRGDTTWKK